MRPYHLTEEQSFRWFMPGDPPYAPSPTEGCWDWTGPTCKGYGKFGMSIDGRYRTILAHRASYRIFHGHLPDELLILHSCDRRICCQPAHIRAGTDGENKEDARKRGQMRVGERVEWAKLTRDSVLLIRAGGRSDQEWANLLGVNRKAVSHARRGITWKHV